jgi:23S rRNA (guanosine2251-2'-O)-methyltransferase
MPGYTPPRQAIWGVDRLQAALDRGEPLRVLLVADTTASPELAALERRAVAAGAQVWRGGPGDLRRMGREQSPPEVMGLLGPSLDPDLPELCGRGGALWLLSGVAYPSNVGFTIRTAEVSGADGVIIDGRFNHADRSRVAHVAMGADRLLPVLYADTLQVLAEARAAGKRIVALEDSGAVAPWQAVLDGPLLIVVGGERDGLDPALLAQCDATLRIPMGGFVPSYNLQAAVAMIAAERLRQLGAA